ncbi:zinc ABC transporter substrate-binding protein [Rhodobacter sp. NTK016B]|nr:zinc ABC transporter substrate-binding protein [Rhodobacter sp. NTK016B]MBN8293088.1 zinc ABC transporter substrate-binding protein [Rhodobacter sp. NTK016B]
MRSLIALSLISTPAFAEVPRVLADTPVTQSLVAQVMGELGQPEMLLDRGGDPHHMQFRPSQARALSGADLVVWIGGGLTPWLDEPLETLASGAVLTLSEVEGLHLREFGEDAADHDHDHDHEHDHDAHDHDDHDHDEHGHEDHDHESHDHDDHDHDGHDHVHSGLDPHLWLDPGNAVIWLETIAETLGGLDPENAMVYEANAQAAIDTTLSLQAELALELAPASGRGLVMFHDAYGYFAETFDLNIVATITGGDATAPGAARLSALRAELQEEGVVCLFPEANHADDFARVVIEGTEMRLGAPLDPAGVTLQPGPMLYRDLLRNMTQTVADCVQG